MNINFKKQYVGLALIGWLVTLSLGLIVILVLTVGFFEGRKAYCKKDGGIKVYETVQLNKDEYSLYLNQFGKLSIPREDEASYDMQYVRSEKHEFIHLNNPIVRRYEFVIKRRSDNKILAERVSYSRVGGDFFALDSSSSFRCPEKIESLFNAVLKRN